VIFSQVILRGAIGACALGLMFGCSAYPDVNKDPSKNNKATFQRDAIDCAQSYPESGSGVHIRQRINCMKLKGWH